MNISLPHESILLLRDALTQGSALAWAEHERSMQAGVFDKLKLSAALAAADARITFKIRVLDKLPSVEVEVAGHPNETPADVIRELTS